MKKLVGAVVFAVAILSAGVAAAACGYQYCWGAVGIGPGGARAWAADYASEAAAINRVQSECGGGCTEIQSFYNTCGAMAVATNGGWGFGWGGTRGIAESNALGYCQQNGPNCGIAAWACSY